MSAASNNKEEQMLLRLIEIEEAKIRASADAPRLAPDKIEAVAKRVLAEKATILADFDRTGALQTQTKSRGAAPRVLVGIAAALVIGVGVIMLWRTDAGIETKLAYAKGSVKWNGQAIAPPAALQKGGTLLTEAKSVVVVAWGKEVLTLHGQNSKTVVTKIEKAHGRPYIDLENLNGLAFVAVEKDKADFFMHTPTAVLGVRGTSFSVTVGAEGSVLRVLEGTVEAATREKPEAKVRVEAKQKVIVARGIAELRVVPLDDAEVQNLVKLAKVAALSREKSAGADAGRVASIDKELEVIVNEINAAADTNGGSAAPQLTLADIRKKYGKVSKVNLKSGASYVGYFMLKGAQMEIITPRGVVRVPTAQLKDVQDLN